MIGFITSIFGHFLVLAMIAAGFLMMFAPDGAKEILKRTVVSAAIFVFAIILLNSMCSSCRITLQY